MSCTRLERYEQAQNLLQAALHLIEDLKRSAGPLEAMALDVALDESHQSLGALTRTLQVGLVVQ